MASQKPSLSIRVKILLLLTLLPVLALAAYLAMAIDVFQNDKIAYVFEGTSSFSRTLSQQANADVTAVLGSVRPVLQDFADDASFGATSENFLKDDSNVDWVAALAQDNSGQFVVKAVVGRDQSLAQTQLEQVVQRPGFLSSIPHLKRSLSLAPGTDRLLVGEYLDDEKGLNRLIFLISFRADSLFQAFRTPSGSENYLIDGSGRILMGSAGMEGESISARYPLSFLGGGDSGPSSGTELSRDAKGDEYLVSYSRLNFGQLNVVSVVPKKVALMAVTTLIRKSLVFFAILICATVMISLVASKNLTAALTQLFQATQRVAQGRFDIRVSVNSSDEVGSLAQSFNRMAGEVSRLMSETAQKARMESELKTAQTVQETLFPPASAQISDLAVMGYYEPASECGGDWWHYNWVNGKIFLWIGDATGHGAPAALITSAAKSASTIIENLRVEPATALDLLNRSIFDISRGKIMMTFFLASYDPYTRMLTYANASHESPYLIRKGEGAPKKRDLIPLNEVNSPRLGESRETRYAQSSIQLTEGDRIFFYTDGIPDIQNPALKSWGEREFIKAVLEANRDYAPIEQSVERLVKSFQSYRQSAELKDDITFFMTEIRGQS